LASSLQAELFGYLAAFSIVRGTALRNSLVLGVRYTFFGADFGFAADFDAALAGGFLDGAGRRVGEGLGVGMFSPSG